MECVFFGVRPAVNDCVGVGVKYCHFLNIPSKLNLTKTRHLGLEKKNEKIDFSINCFVKDFSLKIRKENE